MTETESPTPLEPISAPVKRHLRWGWWSLAVYLTLGIVLEGLHGFKLQWYLGPAMETRRLMWTLAHAHGTLLGLVHLGAALTWHLILPPPAWLTRLASACLSAASIALPGGFFLGGLYPYDGDPGLGILLVPLGAAFLLTAVVALAWSASR